MASLTYLIDKVRQITEYLNQQRANSKRIDELPDATPGSKYVAVFNLTGGPGGTGQTQKQERDAFVNQNNEGRKISIGSFFSDVNNPIAEAVIKVNSQYGLVVEEDQTPIILYGTRYAVPPGAPPGPFNGTLIPIYKYGFLFLAGKGTWGFGGALINSNMIYAMPPENLQPADISPSATTQIIQLNDIGSESNFLAAANVDAHDFTDTDIYYYFSYNVDDVLYLSQFIGTAGEYGGETGNPFEITDFASITNSEVVPGPASQTYDDVLGMGNITSKVAVHQMGLKQIRYNHLGLVYSDGVASTFVAFRDTAEESVVYIPQGRDGEDFLTTSDLFGSGLITLFDKGYQGGIKNTGSEIQIGDVCKAFSPDFSEWGFYQYITNGNNQDLNNYKFLGTFGLDIF